MKTIEEIRHENLLRLIAEAGSIQAFADRIERSHAQASQWKNRIKRASGRPSTIESDSARMIEEKFGKPIGWMDHSHEFEDCQFPNIDKSRLRNLSSEQIKLIEAIITLSEKNHAATANEWPFPHIDQQKLNTLSKDEIELIEGSIALAAQRIGIDVAVRDSTQKKHRTSA